MIGEDMVRNARRKDGIQLAVTRRLTVTVTGQDETARERIELHNTTQQNISKDNIGKDSNIYINSADISAWKVLVQVLVQYKYVL
jgi:hypothetical protein